METNSLRRCRYLIREVLSISVAANADFAYKYFKRMWKPHYLDAHSGAGKTHIEVIPMFFWSSGLNAGHLLTQIASKSQQS